MFQQTLLSSGLVNLDNIFGDGNQNEAIVNQQQFNFSLEKREYGNDNNMNNMNMNINNLEQINSGNNLNQYVSNESSPFDF